ncbi:uncharacterized protein PV07_10543 [Cladophialophora immunda]|uniref:Major facilitator superfamily (MFS) profile domain-containing protein n=1 Tax=Cladophialophora immunda TaxID=569365 RepID=A0A0D2C2Z6_9EURO|nr:uncharacterized protein PV07_10543 [Cladophialophora immunda]KIW24855.1 hypothetical protein PV07_10543 [Cladophialophora immunda]
MTYHSSRFASVGTWIIEFMVVEITPICVHNIGYKIWIIFILLNGVIIVPVTYFFFPETAKMSLEDLDHIFDESGITRGVLSKKTAVVNDREDLEDTAIPISCIQKE